jgi:site-specific recombinase XerD
MPWSETYGIYVSLRQVTRDDVLKAIKPDNGPDIRFRIVAIRSLFRALRQERLVFADPSRGVSLPRREMPPRPLPSDRLAGIVEKVEGAAARLIVVLIAVHALGNEATVRLLMEDLSLARGRLVVRRGYGRRRVIYLEELTRNLLDRWLKYRAQRWPSSTNRYLLVTQQTADGDEFMSPMHIRAILTPLGISPMRLRQDRILDEAKHTEDPVHLMKVFGISDSTAMKYIYAAHPDRQSVIPR